MNSSDDFQLPPGHKSLENGKKEDCPYFQIMKNSEDKNIQKNEKNSKNMNDSDSELSEDEIQGTQGACPFMSSAKKRNPDLGHLEEGYEYFIFILLYYTLFFF